MGKIILLAALVLSGCGYYTVLRDKRFIADLYIGMPIAELEALAGEHRGIQLFYPPSETPVESWGPEEICIVQFSPCYPENLANSLHFERLPPLFDRHGRVTPLGVRRYALTDPTIIIRMGGHRLYPPVIHEITAYYDRDSQTIFGYKETGFLNDLSSHFPLNIR